MTSPATDKGNRCGEQEGPPDGIPRAPCGVFPVESGGPVIGLGILFLVMAIVPIILGPAETSIPAVVLFGGFGFFLIWLGL
ncbi:MAG: hypothetical protein LUQ17_05095, partial [Methanomicrobiales archaeon]|nr:hypothetical protein [Methanomicrobiales archaeon]